MKQQNGFSLLELAIVLAIIGFLLFNVLKANALVTSAKVRQLRNDFARIQSHIHTYQDHYKALPGDDRSASTHVNGNIDGNGNGTIDGRWSDGAIQNTEAFNFWQHIRLANLSSGSTDLLAEGYVQRNCIGGPVGIQSGSTPSIQGLQGRHIVCSSGIAGLLAKQLDTEMDDGDTGSGSLMASVEVDGITASPPVPTTGVSAISNGQVYVVCMKVD